MKSVEIRSETRGGVYMSCVTLATECCREQKPIDIQVEKSEGQKSFQGYQILINSIQISKFINCSWKLGEYYYYYIHKYN